VLTLGRPVQLNDRLSTTQQIHRRNYTSVEIINPWWARGISGLYLMRRLGGRLTRPAPEPVPQTVPPSDDLIDDPAVLVAQRRLRAGEERLMEDDGAGEGGPLAVAGVDVREHDPWRSREVT